MPQQLHQNVVTTDVVSAAPSVAQTAGRKVVVTTEGNYYPVYLKRTKLFKKQLNFASVYLIVKVTQEKHTLSGMLTVINGKNHLS